MAAMTNYLENKLIDHLFRAQSFAAPTNLFIGLLTAAPSDSAAGTEVTGGAYARVQVACSLANWAGTQGDGTTVASSGTSGATSNNGAVTFPAPSGANWGQVTHFAIYDAASGGNMLIYGALTTPKTVNDGDSAPSFAAGTLDFTIDN